jgi:predicted helicase
MRSSGGPGPELIFHYASAVFHSTAYRARFAEFRRTAFPRLPLTGDCDLFRELAAHGDWPGAFAS